MSGAAKDGAWDQMMRLMPRPKDEFTPWAIRSAGDVACPVCLAQRDQDCAGGKVHPERTKDAVRERERMARRGARRDGLLGKLDAIAAGGGALQLDVAEVEMLRRGIEDDYSDE